MSSAASSDPQDSDSKPSHFMDLPPELRLMIYEFALSTFQLKPDQQGQKKHYTPCLLLANKQIRSEASKIYISRLNEILDEKRTWARAESQKCDATKTSIELNMSSLVTMTEKELEKTVNDLRRLHSQRIAMEQELNTVCSMLGLELSRMKQEMKKGIAKYKRS